MKTIYLHIGLPKTGTSSIQQFLSTNRSELVNHGLLYPETGLSYPAHHIYGNVFVKGFRRIIARTKSSTENKGRLFDALKHEIEQSQCEKICISTEELFMINQHQSIKDLFKNYRVKIVVFLRRHDHLYESVSNQVLKSGSHKFSPQRLLFYMETFRIFDYYRLLKPWNKHFGLENIIVIPFEQIQLPQGLITEFFKKIGLPDVDFKFPAIGQKNVSLNRHVIAYLSDVININPDIASSKSIIEALASYSQDNPCSNKWKFIYSSKTRAKLVNKYEKNYQLVAKEYLNRSNGKLFYEKYPDLSSPWEKYPGLPENERKKIHNYLAEKNLATHIN